MEPSQVSKTNRYRAALMGTELLIQESFEYTNAESLNQKDLKCVNYYNQIRCHYLKYTNL